MVIGLTLLHWVLNMFFVLEPLITPASNIHLQRKWRKYAFLHKHYILFWNCNSFYVHQCHPIFVVLTVVPFFFLWGWGCYSLLRERLQVWLSRSYLFVFVMQIVYCCIWWCLVSSSLILSIVFKKCFLLISIVAFFFNWELQILDLRLKSC